MRRVLLLEGLIRMRRGVMFILFWQRHQGSEAMRVFFGIGWKVGWGCVRWSVAPARTCEGCVGEDEGVFL